MPAECRTAPLARLLEQASLSVPDAVRGGQRSPTGTLLGSGRRQLSVFQEALMHCSVGAAVAPLGSPWGPRHGFHAPWS